MIVLFLLSVRCLLSSLGMDGPLDNRAIAAALGMLLSYVLMRELDKDSGVPF